MIVIITYRRKMRRISQLIGSALWVRRPQVNATGSECLYNGSNGFLLDCPVLIVKGPATGSSPLR